jgi:hypothetical protein
MRKYLRPFFAFNENMITVPTIRAICFHDDFYSLGWDHEKVKRGEEDLTDLKDVDKSVLWNPGMVACKNIYYSNINKSKEEIIKLNDEIMDYPVLEPIT